MINTEPYKPTHPIRIVTATSLFDGHDASINIMRRILQSSGAEVIHLGHDRPVHEIVDCAIQEDAQAIAVTSYQGGHMEFFRYMHDLLNEAGCGHIRIFGGGGGVILPDEISALHDYGIEMIYSPDDGREMGLQGMINDLLKRCDFPAGNLEGISTESLRQGKFSTLGRMITAAENNYEGADKLLVKLSDACKEARSPVLGITGTGGAGKSSLTDEILRRYLDDFPDRKIAVISVDPTRRRSGGALLGDRIRMNAASGERVFMRSLATRQSNLALSRHITEVLCIVKNGGFSLVILESSGIGQSDTEIIDHSDFSLYVMTPEFGAASQLEKIDMIDYADAIAINKADKRGALDALRDVKKQFQRNRSLFDRSPDKMPVYATIASQFNDQGVNSLYRHLMDGLNQRFIGKFESDWKASYKPEQPTTIIPPNRIRYLSEIADTIRKYNQFAEKEAQLVKRYESLTEAQIAMKEQQANPQMIAETEKLIQIAHQSLHPETTAIIDNWDAKQKRYHDPVYTYRVRGKEIAIETHTQSLSHQSIPKVVLPAYRSLADVVYWSYMENVPGEFPYAAGVFPFKREAEDPTRMFAGEGGPERTNKRFHYLSAGMPAIRLSTAFDSVTLYGRDPGTRPDIYGKIGNAGVSIACLDDAKKLYSGFNLADAATSVSMTINGPAPAMAAFFLNAAIDQQCELYVRQQGNAQKTSEKIDKFFRERAIARPVYQGDLPMENNGLGLLFLGVPASHYLPEEIYNRIKADTLCRIRGTVQADILKEDQAQNTCIFSTDFALRMMGDMQEYFINQNISQFYSVSVSGYHIAEAGANPLSQLAFTLANGFTLAEYYLSRGMKIDDFAPNFSFFFSNGIDPEYSVLGRVARIIWAKAMKQLYIASPRSQMLKYHIQTSGRSLHAQEIDFNDIRTTLQALYAIYDNCNSLHTNAYDEAITTPTEESVRRAIAIQLIINKELGLAKNQNPLQGAFIIEELTRLVEEAVLAEFDRLTERGGVLGAMETMYQRGKIQEESLYYENQKHSGEYPIIGVNTFLSSKGSPTIIPSEVIRATQTEKDQQIKAVTSLQALWQTESQQALKNLRLCAVSGGNTFENLMEVAKYCTIGQITEALFETGGQYRRNM
ncbi:MAG TPA: methylmalonyl-CoA mutase [Bacteroidales bacterium]|nr:MAG: methylmalonyl-CoA mutase [Bacteroidetes bacterium GWE2_42_24]OFY31267.1 MAG: methylmalonyl-CoA mutase [Bacteroidetes bacterium GWF2_43_11]HBZ65638.1 methylmalonyl-CoA mutase [Bacteroidales bacterium]